MIQSVRNIFAIPELRRRVIFDQDVGARQPAEQRRFPGIGIADDRGIRHRRAFAVFALRGAGRADGLDRPGKGGVPDEYDLLFE